MKKNPLPYPLVLIEWVDASGCSPWTPLDDIKEWVEDEDTQFKVHEVGWLIMETKTYIVLSPQIGKDGVLGNTMRIPRVWSMKKTVLLPVGK